MRIAKQLQPGEAPAEVLALVEHLVPALISGDHPALAALREQFRCARIKSVEMTGDGFYLDFEIPRESPLAEPPDFAGGDATITLEGANHPAGCVLFVRDGRLATLDCYMQGDPWPEHPRVVAIDDVFPLRPQDAK